MDRNEKQNSFRNRQVTRGIRQQIGRLKKEILLLRICLAVVLCAFIIISCLAWRMYRKSSEEKTGPANPPVSVSTSSEGSGSGSQSSVSNTQEQTAAPAAGSSSSAGSASSEASPYSEDPAAAGSSSASGGSSETAAGSSAESASAASSAGSEEQMTSEPEDGGSIEERVSAVLGDTTGVTWRTSIPYGLPEVQNLSGSVELSGEMVKDAAKIYMLGSLCRRLTEGYGLPDTDDASRDRLALELLGKEDPDPNAGEIPVEQRFLEMLGSMTAPPENPEAGASVPDDIASSELDKGVAAVNSFIREMNGENSRTIAYSAGNGLISSLTAGDAEVLFNYLIYLPSTQPSNILDSDRHALLKGWLSKEGTQDPVLVTKTREKCGELPVPWFSCGIGEDSYVILAAENNDGTREVGEIRGYVLSVRSVKKTDENILGKLAETVYDTEIAPESAEGTGADGDHADNSAIAENDGSTLGTSGNMENQDAAPDTEGQTGETAGAAGTVNGQETEGQAGSNTPVSEGSGEG